MKAYKVIYSGKVQGICFRATALDMSASFDVTGYVMNLEDGSVELVVEGEDPEVMDFISKIDKQFETNIEQNKKTEQKLEGFGEFSIRH